MTYQEQLLDDRWLELKQEIINRDFRMCQKCMSTRNLEVHHLQYIDGRMAWEYEEFYLLTLCSSCHEKEHEGKDIKDFVKPPDIIKEAGARIKRAVWALKELAKRG